QVGGTDFAIEIEFQNVGTIRCTVQFIGDLSNQVADWQCFPMRCVSFGYDFLKNGIAVKCKMVSRFCNSWCAAENGDGKEVFKEHSAGEQRGPSMMSIFAAFQFLSPIIGVTIIKSTVRQ